MHELQVKCVVFDKTGTLTIGRPVVVETKLFANLNLREFCEMAAATEVLLYSLALHLCIAACLYLPATANIH